MQQKSTPRLHDNRASPVSRDPAIAVPGSRLTGLRFFHVIAFAGHWKYKIKLAPVSHGSSLSHQPGWLAPCNTSLKVISAHRSSPANRASPAHVIRPLPRLGLGPSRYPPCWKRRLFTWVSWQLVEVRAVGWGTREPRQIVLVHRTLADKARQDVLRSSTVRYRPTSPDFVADLSEFTAH